MPFPRTTDPSVPKARSKHTAAHSLLIHGCPGTPLLSWKDLGQGPRFTSSSFCTQMRESPWLASEGIAERRQRSRGREKPAVSRGAPESCLPLALWLSEPSVQGLSVVAGRGEHCVGPRQVEEVSAGNLEIKGPLRGRQEARVVEPEQGGTEADSGRQGCGPGKNPGQGVQRSGMPATLLGTSCRGRVEPAGGTIMDRALDTHTPQAGVKPAQPLSRQFGHMYQNSLIIIETNTGILPQKKIHRGCFSNA